MVATKPSHHEMRIQRTTHPELKNGLVASDTIIPTTAAPIAK